jgi:MFS family permease
LLWLVLRVSGVINGAWYTAYFIGLPLMLVQAGIANGVAAFGLVISAYGVTNLISNLIVGSRDVRRRPGRLIFGGNLFVGCGILVLGLSGLLLPPAWLVAGCVAAALISAIGGPMQDITVATLRQTELPAADIPAAVRAFVVVSQLGSLAGLAASPLLFVAAGVPGTVLLCAAAMIATGVVGLMRLKGTGAIFTESKYEQKSRFVG